MVLYIGAGVREGTVPLAQLLVGFHSLPPLPTSKLSPSGADSWVGVVCACSRTLWVSPTNSPLILGVSPAATTLQVFIVSGFEAFFSLTGTLGCMVCLAPQLFLLVYPPTNVGLLSPPAAALSHVLSAPSTGLNECFFLTSLVVGLPYNLIFWQFCLFFVFKFVVVCLLVVQGGTDYLPMPLSWPEVINLNSLRFSGDIQSPGMTLLIITF